MTLITPAELAVALRVPVRKIRRLANDGKIPVAAEVGLGKRQRFDIVRVLEHLSENGGDK